MFQLKRWNRGVLHRNGQHLKISVSHPSNPSGEIVFALISIVIAFGLLRIFLPSIFKARSFERFLTTAGLGLIFLVPTFFISRRSLEQEFGGQTVIVDSGKIIWSRETRWWKRQRDLNVNDVTAISVSEAWGGFGNVEISAKGRRHRVLERLVREDAMRFASELKHVIHT